MGLLENALSLRTSARAGVAIPRIFKHLGRKTKLFPSNRGAATPVTSVTGSQRHTFLTAPKCVYSDRSRPLRPSSVSAVAEPGLLETPCLRIRPFPQRREGVYLFAHDILFLRPDCKEENRGQKSGPPKRPAHALRIRWGGFSHISKQRATAARSVL